MRVVIDKENVGILLNRRDANRLKALLCLVTVSAGERTDSARRCLADFVGEKQAKSCLETYQQMVTEFNKRDINWNSTNL